MILYCSGVSEVPGASVEEGDSTSPPGLSGGSSTGVRETAGALPTENKFSSGFESTSYDPPGIAKSVVPSAHFTFEYTVGDSPLKVSFMASYSSMISRVVTLHRE